jgi:hypothetical protein
MSYNPGMWLSRCCSLIVFCAIVWLPLSGCAPSGTASDSKTDGASESSAAKHDSEAVTPVAKSQRPDSTSEVFERADVLTLTLEIGPAERAKLAENPREYVRCRLSEKGGDAWQEIAVKLKGAAGSFNDLNKMDKFQKKKKPSFHGLSKFHLNNSVQDDTYLNEWLCAGLFRDAGVPAPRVAHARVFLDDRDLGLYVVKEGFDRKFIARYFATDDGNLYDGGFCQDIDNDLERDEGQGKDSHADQHALCEACRLENLEERWAKIAERLDVEQFLTFASMELMTGHWDGYCWNKNNYRLYFDSVSHKAFFLPHGMDQMFGDPGASILQRPGAIVAGAVMENPEWRERYRDRIRKLLPLFDPPDKLLEQVDRVVPRIQSAIQQFDPDQATAYADRIQDLKSRLTARAASLREQSEQPDPPPPGPLEFNGDEGIEIGDWQPAGESEDAVHEVIELPEEHAAYVIRCGEGGSCIASWRRGVLLARGEYRLVASAATTGVVPIKDARGPGAGIRISGKSRETGLEGSADWQPLEYRFTVTEDVQEIVLVAELRATAGEVRFDNRSLRLFRVAE